MASPTAAPRSDRRLLWEEGGEGMDGPRLAARLIELLPTSWRDDTVRF